MYEKIIFSVYIYFSVVHTLTVNAEEGIKKFYINAVVEENGDLTVEEYFYLNVNLMVWNEIFFIKMMIYMNFVPN